MISKKVYNWLYKEMSLKNLKGQSVLLFQMLLIMVSLGFGTYTTILLNYFDIYAVTPFETVTSATLLLFVVLFWLGISFIVKGIFLIVNSVLYLSLFFKTINYYSIWILISTVVIWLPLIYEVANNKFYIKMRGAE